MYTENNIKLTELQENEVCKKDQPQIPKAPKDCASWNKSYSVALKCKFPILISIENTSDNIKLFPNEVISQKINVTYILFYCYGFGVDT